MPRQRNSQKIPIFQDIALNEDDSFQYVPSTIVHVDGMDSLYFSDREEELAYYNEHILPFSRMMQKKLMREEKESVAAQSNIKANPKQQLEDLILRCAAFDDISDDKYQEVINLCKDLCRDDDFGYIPSTVVHVEGMDSLCFSDPDEEQAYYDEHILPFSKMMQKKLMREERERVAVQLNIKGDSKQLEDLILRCAAFDNITDDKYQEVINLCRNLRNVINSARKPSDRRKDKCFKNIDKENVKPKRRSGRPSVPRVNPTFYVGQIVFPSKTQKKSSQKRRRRTLSPTTVLSNIIGNETVCRIFNLTNKKYQEKLEKSSTDSVLLEQSQSMNSTKRRLYSREKFEEYIRDESHELLT